MTDAINSNDYQPYQRASQLNFNQAYLQLDTEFVEYIYDQDMIAGFKWAGKKVWFAPHDVTHMHAILTIVDGTRNLQDIVSHTNLKSGLVTAVLQTFYELGALVLSSPTSVPSVAFYRHTVARMRAKRYIMLQKNPIISENMTKSQLMGFLVDSYHFIAAASSHMSLAITQAPSKKIEYVLSKYLQEEYWHGELIAKGLIAGGLDRYQLENAWPSFAIQGIINYIRHYARTDLEAYGLCAAVTEADPAGPERADDQPSIWDQLKALNLVPHQAIDAFQKHDRLDYEAQHGDIPEVIFDNDQSITYQRQQQLLGVVSNYIDMIGYAYRHLVDHYRDQENQLWFNAA